MVGPTADNQDQPVTPHASHKSLCAQTSLRAYRTTASAPRPALPALSVLAPVIFFVLSVVAVSVPTEGIACLSNLTGSRGVRLATVAPRSGNNKGFADSGDPARSGAGIAGVALRGSSSGDGMMEVRGGRGEGVVVISQAW